MSAGPFPRLFSPLALGPALTLRNRVVFSPHTSGFAEPGGHLGPREAAYQAARAQGGVALTVLGTSVVHPTSSTDYGVLANLDEGYLPGYRQVADAVHAHGAALFAQLNHQGLAAKGRGPGHPLYAPSAIPSPIHGEVPREAAPGLLRELTLAFAAGADRCRRAGLDGVLVHAAHGFLINQFLSPRTNRRTDRYGGSLDNRLRFLREVLEAMRRAVGPAFVVGVRLSVDELIPGGLDLRESLAIARRLDADRLVDYLDVSTGVDWEWISKSRHYPGMHWPLETWVDLAAAVKAAVAVPVACAGRIREPQQAERLLAEGKLDLVQMARALIADPDWVAKASRSPAPEIRPCLYISSGCLGRVDRGLPLSCVQNPAAGREATLASPEPARVPRRVVVVGGGPAGLQAATVAAERGHHVVLLEREPRLGGQQWLAAQAPGRQDLLRGLAYLERRLRDVRVTVRLEVEADVAGIVAERPDVVVVASGSRPAPLDVPGVDSGRVLSVHQVLAGVPVPGPRVLVIDGLGRLAAASVADLLATRSHPVTLLTHDYAAGGQIDPTTRPAVERRLREGGVRVVTGTEIVAVEGSRVSLRDCFTGRGWTLDGVDAIVPDLGGRVDDTLYAALCDRGVEALQVGDALAPRGLEEAYHEGYRAAIGL
jgi:mycofactocin system FadH/OYE family oxidoreductase 2